MKKVFKDVFREDEVSNKISSKKVYGGIAFILCTTSYVLDMFTVYKVNLTLFDSMLIFAASMLGASMVKSFGRGGSYGSANVQQNGRGGRGGHGGYGNGGYGNGGYGNQGGSNINVNVNNADMDTPNPNYDDAYYDPEDPNNTEGTK